VSAREERRVNSNLDPDALVTALESAGDVIPLSGFLGRGPDNRVRLFLDPELKVWIDFPADQVVHRHRISVERGTFGPSSVIWVRGEWLRRRLIDERLRHAIAEEFLIGEFALRVMLPESLLDAIDRAAEFVRRTTMHTRHCPR
jgi:hypothetical protein